MENFLDSPSVKTHFFFPNHDPYLVKNRSPRSQGYRAKTEQNHLNHIYSIEYSTDNHPSKQHQAAPHTQSQHLKTTRVIHEAQKTSTQNNSEYLGQWSANIARCALEAIEGYRPLKQLAPWTSPAQYKQLEQRRKQRSAGKLPQALCTKNISGRQKPVRIVTFHCHKITSNKYESVIVLHDGTRGRAAALQLEMLNRRWMVTRIRLG